MNETKKREVNYMTDLSARQAQAVMTFENAIHSEGEARKAYDAAGDKVINARIAMIRLLCNGES